ncbi:MAG: phage late control D family protein [Gammaproteobacteria bacterium]
MNLAKLRYAPEFRVHIDGEPIPAALRASISSVNYQTGIEGSDRVELILVNERRRWLDHKLLSLGRELKLEIGYAPDPLQQVFVGDIVAQSASFPSSGVPSLTVVAQDRIERLQRGMTRPRLFAVELPSVGFRALPDPAIAILVSLENGLLPMIETVGAVLAAVLGVKALGSLVFPSWAQKSVRKQVKQSDFELLQCIARENGFEMMIDHEGSLGGKKLRFMSLLNRITPEVTLQYGRSLIEFTPRISDVGQIVSITAFVWLAPIKTDFTVTLGWDWDKFALTLDVRPGVTPIEKRRSHYLIEEPVSLITAPEKLVSELIPRLNKRLTGSGSTVGDPKIRAGTVLRLKGLGVQFGGLYRVTSATHSIDSGGYRTSFEVRKEIWFGKIPLFEQGALPIDVSASVIS